MKMEHKTRNLVRPWGSRQQEIINWKSRARQEIQVNVTIREQNPKPRRKALAKKHIPKIRISQSLRDKHRPGKIGIYFWDRVRKPFHPQDPGKDPRLLEERQKQKPTTSGKGQETLLAQDPGPKQRVHYQ